MCRAGASLRIELPRVKPTSRSVTRGIEDPTCDFRTYACEYRELHPVRIRGLNATNGYHVDIAASEFVAFAFDLGITGRPLRRERSIHTLHSHLAKTDSILGRASESNMMGRVRFGVVQLAAKGL